MRVEYRYSFILRTNPLIIRGKRDSKNASQKGKLRGFFERILRTFCEVFEIESRGWNNGAD